MCGDPYCGSCGSPGAAEAEAFTDAIIERLVQAGIESDGDFEEILEMIEDRKIVDDYEREFVLANLSLDVIRPVLGSKPTTGAVLVFISCSLKALRTSLGDAIARLAKYDAEALDKAERRDAEAMARHELWIKDHEQELAEHDPYSPEI